MIKYGKLLIFFSSIIVINNLYSNYFLKRTFSFHNNKINAISISPNNGFIATGSWDGDVVIYNRTTSQKKRIYEKKPGILHFITSLAFSSDNKLIIIGSSDYSPTIWNLATGNKKLTLNGHSDFISSVSFFNNNNFILTSSYDYYAIIWNANGQIKFKLKHPDSVLHCLISYNNSFIVSATKELAFVWNAFDGSLKFKLEARQNNKLTAIAISPNNKFIVTAYEDGNVIVWDSLNGKPLFIFSDHSNFISCLIVSDNYVVTGGYDSSVCVRDLNNGQFINKLVDFIPTVILAADFINKNIIVTGSSDRIIRLWNLKNGKLIRKFKNLKNDVTNLVSSSNKGYFLGTCMNTSYLFKKRNNS